MGPLYGVDGNLLVEERMVPGGVSKRYPQLRDERAKRRHRSAYRAHLEAKRHLLSSPRS
jgi:hypothetical protein